jgi:hypothetical protein
VIHENSVVAAITKEGAAEFSDIRWCFHPARRFRIEISKFLQPSILLPGGLPIGVNGIKLYAGFSVCHHHRAGTILRIPCRPTAQRECHRRSRRTLALDDFAFGSDGSIFAAGQGGEITRIFPDGTMTLIPTGTFGNAAVAFGRTPSDSHSLYVVNNGGVFLSLPNGPEAGSIVRLDTDITGVLPETQIVPEPSTMALGLVGLTLACSGAASFPVSTREGFQVLRISATWSGHYWFFPPAIKRLLYRLRSNLHVRMPGCCPDAV